MTTTSEAKGVFPVDIVVRTGIKLALDDLRRNPYLLDYVFGWLLEDDQTKGIYGQKEAERAKEFFLRNDVPVVMDTRMEAPEPFSVSVSLVDSIETETSTGDTHYEPSEFVEASWTPLSAAFTPVDYVPATGALELPAAIGNSLFVIPGMLLIDRTGAAHPILTVLDRVLVTIAPNVNADLTGCVIKGAKPELSQFLESVNLKESVRVGVHVVGEPVYLTWLHAIVAFCLLRYKEQLFEGRGFERSTTSWGPAAKDERFGSENMFTRFATLTGYTRWSWPKYRTQNITSVSFGFPGLRAGAANTEHLEFVGEPGNDDPEWTAGKPL